MLPSSDMNPRSHGPQKRWQALALTALTLFLLGADSSMAQDDRGRQREPNRPQEQQSLPKPENPAAIKARWTVAGQEQSITEGEFYDAHTLLNKLEGSSVRGITVERTWERVLLLSEAESYGLVVTKKELDEALSVGEPEMHDGLIMRWQAQGITAEQGREHSRTTAMIKKLKDFYLNTSRITTQDAFDKFKAGKLHYKLDYLLFASEDFADSAVKVDDATLKTYWSENKAVAPMFREPGRISAEYLYLDPKSFSLEKAAEVAGSAPLSREKALAYFREHREALLREVPPEKNHFLTIDDGTKLGDIVSPFELLQDTIKKKLLLEKVLAQAHAAATKAGPTADLESLAKKYSLGYDKVEKIDRPGSIAALRRFGFNAFTTAYAANAGEVTKDILEERGLRYFFRLNQKTASRLPSFDEVKDRLKEHYTDARAADGARAAAAEVLANMSSKVDSELASVRAELDEEADRIAESRIAQLGLSKAADKNRERARARSSVRQRLDAEKKKLLPKYFEEYVRTNKPVVHETDYFEFQAVRRNRSRIADKAKSRSTFLETNYYIRSLKPGEITPILLEDHATKSYFIARLADLKDPDISSMGPVDLLQNRAQLSQIRNAEFMRRWRYRALRERLDVKSGN